MIDKEKSEIVFYSTFYSFRGLMGTFRLLSHACSVITFLFFNTNYRVLSSGTNADDKTLLFEIVFIIVWVGAGVISINGKLLGGKMYSLFPYKWIYSSFFQSVCLLGYCLFPLNIAAFINLGIGNSVHILVKLGYIGLAFIWSTYCNTNIFS